MRSGAGAGHDFDDPAREDAEASVASPSRHDAGPLGRHPMSVDVPEREEVAQESPLLVQGELAPERVGRAAERLLGARPVPVRGELRETPELPREGARRPRKGSQASRLGVTRHGRVRPGEESVSRHSVDVSPVPTRIEACREVDEGQPRADDRDRLARGPSVDSVRGEEGPARAASRDDDVPHPIQSPSRRTWMPSRPSLT